MMDGDFTDGFDIIYLIDEICKKIRARIKKNNKA